MMVGKPSVQFLAHFPRHIIRPMWACLVHCVARRKKCFHVFYGALHGVLPAIFEKDRMTGIWDSAPNLMKPLWFIGCMDAGCFSLLGVSHIFEQKILTSFHFSQLFQEKIMPGFKAWAVQRIELWYYGTCRTSCQLVFSCHVPFEKATCKRYVTPLKTNMTFWKMPIFNRKYIFKWWMFHCHVSFRGG